MLYNLAYVCWINSWAPIKEKANPTKAGAWSLLLGVRSLMSTAEPGTNLDQQSRPYRMRPTSRLPHRGQRAGTFTPAGRGWGRASAYQRCPRGPSTLWDVWTHRMRPHGPFSASRAQGLCTCCSHPLEGASSCLDPPGQFLPVTELPAFPGPLNAYNLLL